MDRTFDGLTKVLDKILYEHKYLEKEEVQGSSKRDRTSVECPLKENNPELASRHQVSDQVFVKVKGPEPRLSAQRIATLS